MRYATLILGVMGVASAALFARSGIDAGATPLELSAWRLLLASGVLVLYQLRRWGKAPRLSRQEFGLLALAGVFLALHFATWIASLAYVSVGRSTLLVATCPLWTGLAAYLLPVKRPGRWFWIGLAVAGMGTFAVASSPGTLRAGESGWLGDVLALAGAVCIVPYMYASQYLQPRLGSLRTITGMYSFAGLALWAVCFCVGQARVPQTPTVWLAVVGMAVFAQLVGHSMLNLSLRAFSAGQVAAATLLEPVFAALLAWPVLGEVPGWQAALGGAVLLAGVGLALRS